MAFFFGIVMMDSGVVGEVKGKQGEHS